MIDPLQITTERAKYQRAMRAIGYYRPGSPEWLRCKDTIDAYTQLQFDAISDLTAAKQRLESQLQASLRLARDIDARNGAAR